MPLYVLAVMTTAGLYETSGDWLFDTGLPGKSGISGGIASVSPGKGGLGTFNHRSTTRAIASKDNWWLNSFLDNWEWIYSAPNQDPNKVGTGIGIVVFVSLSGLFERVALGGDYVH